MIATRRGRRRGRGWRLAALIAATTPLAATSLFDLGGVPSAEAAGASGKAEVDGATVGIGDVLEYTLTVTSSGDDSPARNPTPGSTDGFTLVKTTTSTQHSFSFGGGGGKSSVSVTVRYRLRAEKLGVHTLGPGRMYVDGVPVKTPAVTVNVVPAGKAPKAKPAAPDPFTDDSFFGGDPPQPVDEPPPTPNIAPVDPLAAVDSLPTDPAERTIFVRIVPATRRPVVGEQVTTKLFVYTLHPPRLAVKRPPTFPDFATIDLGHIDSEWHPMTIGGQHWAYAAAAGYGAFPLKTGSLTIGAAEVEYADPFAPSGGHDLASNTVSLEVIEPPLDGRPPGYVLGDVASDLHVLAELTPRLVVDGHAVLTLRMRGNGRLDGLRAVLPSPAGVTWTPTGDEAKTEVDGTAVRGARKLVYDLAFETPGDYELGDAAFHVWDPQKKTYASPSASIGKARVTKAVAPASSTEAAGPIDKLPDVRHELGAGGEGSSLADHTWTFGLIAGMPLAVVLAQGGVAFARRSLRKRAATKERPESLAEMALAEARDAEKRGDVPACAAASTRAIDRSLEAATGLRSRGLTTSELTRGLGEAGVEDALGTRIIEALASLEAARFAGAGMPTVAEVSRIVGALHELARRAASSEAPS